MSKYKDNSWLRIGINLALACMISGVVVATTYHFTAPVAAGQMEKQKNKAMREIAPMAEDFKPIAGKEGWFTGLSGGKVVAYIIPAERVGYEGLIKILVAVDTDNKIITYKVLQHKETPGLGDKASKTPFIKQFAGKSSAQLVVLKTPTQDNIQAITGATITSNAVTKAIKASLTELIAYRSGGKVPATDAVTEATGKAGAEKPKTETPKPNKKVDAMTEATDKQDKEAAQSKPESSAAAEEQPAAAKKSESATNNQQEKVDAVTEATDKQDKEAAQSKPESSVAAEEKPTTAKKSEPAMDNKQEKVDAVTEATAKEKK